MSILEPITVKLVVVGDGNVGKTCILLSYTTDEFPQDYVPTVFENYTTQTAIDNRMINFSLWDTAGQETYNRLRTLSYNQADIFLIVFSVVESSSFENAISKWYPELCHEDLLSVPKIFVGNKIDMRNESNPEHIQTQTAETKIKERNCKYFECSALTQKGLKEVFDEALKTAIKEKNLRSQLGNNLTSQQIDKRNQPDNDNPKQGCLCCNIF